MNLFVLFMSVTFLNSAWSKVDYSHCSRFIDDANANRQKTNFYYPFSIDKKTGKLKTTDYDMEYNGEKKGESTYSSAGYGGSIEIIVKESELSKISEIKIIRNHKKFGN